MCGCRGYRDGGDEASDGGGVEEEGRGAGEPLQDV